jgi:hypothetical protein
MNNFKEFYKDRPVFKVIEKIDIDGVGNMTAKIDSGNEAYNVLHGINIIIDGTEATFTTIDNKTLTLPIKDTIIINIGSGIKEERPVMLFDIIIKDKHYRSVPFSIADRTENDEKVLVGAPFIKSINALIDVA